MKLGLDWQIQALAAGFANPAGAAWVISLIEPSYPIQQPQYTFPIHVLSSK
jgi:hypothetical protein